MVIIEYYSIDNSVLLILFIINSINYSIVTITIIFKYIVLMSADVDTNYFTNSNVYTRIVV